jgi:hypothetical protein
MKEIFNIGRKFLHSWEPSLKIKNLWKSEENEHQHIDLESVAESLDNVNI